MIWRTERVMQFYNLISIIITFSYFNSTLFFVSENINIYIYIYIYIYIWATDIYKLSDRNKSADTIEGIRN